MSMITILVVILLILALGGGVGYHRGYGPVGFGPFGLALVVVMVLLAMGRI